MRHQGQYYYSVRGTETATEPTNDWSFMAATLH